MNDRIKLAKAMGWERIDSMDGRTHYGLPPGCKIDDESIISWTDSCLCIPDPFTCANDDYAVLEWMRTQDKHLQYKFGDAMFNVRLSHAPTASGVPSYQIGDFARAALKVIDSGVLTNG